MADQLRQHLFPGDGLEAAALLLCAEAGERRKLLGREIIPVPYEECTRWTISSLGRASMSRRPSTARRRAVVVIAVHSHPGGLFAFSSADDESDRILMSALRHGTDRMAGSAIMIPNGAVRARIYEDDRATPVDLVMNVGPTSYMVERWRDGRRPLPPPMAFTGAMRAWLGRISVCVIGVSGTGSIVAEQLARLGVGEIILIDFDKVEERNLNRILNSSLADIGVLKVEMFAAAIRRYRPDCE